MARALSLGEAPLGGPVGVSGGGACFGARPAGSGAPPCWALVLEGWASSPLPFREGSPHPAPRPSGGRRGRVLHLDGRQLVECPRCWQGLCRVRPCADCAASTSRSRRRLPPGFCLAGKPSGGLPGLAVEVDAA